MSINGLPEVSKLCYGCCMSINAPLQEKTRLEIKYICQQMVEGEIGFVEGARQILGCASDAMLKDDDPDLIVFRGITSETHEVPSARMLELWNSDAIVKNAPKWAQLENWAKEYGTEACHNLLSRF